MCNVLLIGMYYIVMHLCGTFYGLRAFLVCCIFNVRTLDALYCTYRAFFLLLSIALHFAALRFCCPCVLAVCVAQFFVLPEELFNSNETSRELFLVFTNAGPYWLLDFCPGQEQTNHSRAAHPSRRVSLPNPSPVTLTLTLTRARGGQRQFRGRFL